MFNKNVCRRLGLMTGLFTLPVAAVVAEPAACNGGEDVLVKISLAAVKGENQFASQGVHANSIEWPLLRGFWKKQHVCVPKRKFQPQFESFKAKNGDASILASANENLVFKVDTAADSLKVDWSIDLLGLAGLPEMREGQKRYLKPLCTLQTVEFESAASTARNGQYSVNAAGASPSLEACQGGDILQDIWGNLDKGKHVWSLSVTMIPLTEKHVQEETIENKAIEFLKSHPVEPTAKKRMKKR